MCWSRAIQSFNDLWPVLREIRREFRTCIGLEDSAKPCDLPHIDSNSTQAKGAVSTSRDRGPENGMDFGIIVALPLELQAVLGHLADCQQIVVGQADQRTYFRGNIVTERGSSYRLVVAMVPRMGNLDAALLTADMIRAWKPRHVLVVGIAGGTVPGSQHLGDVVVSDNVVYYEQAKLKPGSIELRPVGSQSDPLLFDRARNFMGNWHDAIQISPPNSVPCVPSVQFGPIASGEKVIADTTFLRSLLALNRRILAVEMEAAGVAQATLKAVTHTGFLVVRGICDFADSSKKR